MLKTLPTLLATALFAVAPVATISVAALPAAPPLAGGVDWEIVTTSNGSQPTARHEAAYVEFGGLFYLMGGRGPRPVDRYDPVAKTWTNLGSPPIQMHHFQPVVWGTEVYVVCAFEGNFPNETPIANIYTYDPATNNWQIGPAIPAGRNRGAAGVVVYDDFIYVAGGNTLGHNGGYVPWLDRYDPATNTWTQLADAPHARDHFTAAVIGNKLYAGGGRQTEQPNPFLNTIGPVDVYDFTTGQWSSVPDPIPTERAGTMTVARDEHLIIIGGETASKAHDETEALDVGTGEWLTLPTLVDSRHSGGALLYQDVAYVASGAGNNGGGPELTTQESLELTTLLGESSSNLTANGDFDDGLTGWEDAGDLTLNAADGGIASPALDIENGLAARSAAVEDLETYTLSCLYQVLGTTGSVTIGMEYLNGGGQKIGEDIVSVGATTAYTSFSLSGTTPDLTRVIRAVFYADGDRTLRIDDVVLVEKAAEIVRLGVPANPRALLPSSNGPVAGLVWNPAIDHTDFMPTATMDFLAIGFVPVNFVTGLGTVLIDIISPVLLTAAPGASFNIPLPFDPVIVGIQLYVQGASIDATDAQATNALDVTFQKP